MTDTGVPNWPDPPCALMAAGQGAQDSSLSLLWLQLAAPNLVALNSLRLLSHCQRSGVLRSRWQQGWLPLEAPGQNPPPLPLPAPPGPRWVLKLLPTHLGPHRSESLSLPSDWQSWRGRHGAGHRAGHPADFRDISQMPEARHPGCLPHPAPAPLAQSWTRLLSSGPWAMPATQIN